MITIFPYHVNAQDTVPVAGWIKYNDGTSVSSGVTVYVTNNNTSDVETDTTNSEGVYIVSVHGTTGNEIWVNVSYIGNSSGNGFILNTSAPSQICNVTISEVITSIYVDDDYNSSSLGWHINAFNTIQDGIDVVPENGTVYVYNGTYNENINIDKSINLIGENKNTTIINNNESSNIVTISNSHVNVSNFTINGSSSAGIKIHF